MDLFRLLLFALIYLGPTVAAWVAIVWMAANMSTGLFLVSGGALCAALLVYCAAGILATLVGQRR